MLLILNKPWAQQLIRLLLWTDQRLLFINKKR